MEMKFTDKDTLHLIIKDGETEVDNSENYELFVLWMPFHRVKLTATQFFVTLFDKSGYDIDVKKSEWGNVCKNLMNKHSLRDEYAKYKSCQFNVKYDQEGKPYIAMHSHVFTREKDGTVTARFTSDETVDYTYKQLSELFYSSDSEKGDD